VDDEEWVATSLLTVRVQVLPDARANLRARQRVRFHLGTSEVMGRILPLDDAEVRPGESAWAQLRLEAPVVARAGDRFVLRHYSPVHTVAGGTVIEITPPRRKRLTDALRSGLEQVRERGAGAVLAAVQLAGESGLAVAALPLHTGLDRESAGVALETALQAEVFRAGTRLFTRVRAADVRGDLVAAVRLLHETRPLLQGIDREELRRAAGPASPVLVDAVLEELLAAGLLVAFGSVIALREHKPQFSAGQTALAAELTGVLAAAGLAAPKLAELPETLRSHPDVASVARHLASEGTLVALAHDHFADARAVREAISALRTHFADASTLTTAELKQVLPVSRKYLIPLLEYFDRSGVTRRVAEERILLPVRQ
jgi:selenocysteine-specific elongation factor